MISTFWLFFFYFTLASCDLTKTTISMKTIKYDFSGFFFKKFNFNLVREQMKDETFVLTSKTTTKKEHYSNDDFSILLYFFWLFSAGFRIGTHYFWFVYWRHEKKNKWKIVFCNVRDEIFFIFIFFTHLILNDSKHPNNETTTKIEILWDRQMFHIFLLVIVWIK